MVGIPTNFTKDPVAKAHALINEPDTPIDRVLSALVPPPLEYIPHVDDPRATVGTWVRYNALVQDIWDTELFVASSPDGQSGLLVENAAASDHAQAVLCERLPVYLVSRPGQSKWTLPDRVEPGVVPKSANNPNGQKRPRESDDQMSDAGPAPQSTTPPSIPVTLPPEPVNADQASSKRHCADGVAGSVLISSMGLNLPVHNQHGASAIVAKLYDTATGRDLKINSMVEVVGVLQDALEFNMDGATENGEGLQNEVLARNPANVKRLHVISWREMKSWEHNPLTKALGADQLVEAKKEAQSLVGGLRELLVRYFASALFNDLLAAEYLVMCLLSRPIRTRGDNVLGKLSVNIVLPSDSTASAVQELARAIKEVFPTVVEIEVNLSSLNATEMYPRKDYDMNRLKAGALQMAAGTCLITNECNMTNGRLGKRGVKNIKALTNVSQRCSMPIEFVYYESEVGVDCCTVLLSKGGKSVVPADVVVRVKPNPGLELQQWNAYNSDLLRKLRLALALFAEDGVFDISPETTQDVEKVYVEARRNGAAKDGQDTLQKWLGVARACARMHGESVMTVHRWRYALDLEQKREQRGRS
ncbi:Mini-chromosome maintenance complex-binding protein [Gracilariopsis chorda]|uniref:Mini-chromosome maintenance complex-binding protein n=1 Tax=Gracilariopsis chorda TaxID=448386 RepID=A0A2V3J6B1_9FLOR|nr:Mini-chromosome maintenance complex-binding protein [Gracilariopsis chorda]|eukprot:PXF49662.1 Mini-chromosome maintenance complex-binding protein [Gracilariopsis chorda]